MPKFGDILENKYASHENPHWKGIYVRAIHKKGLINPGKHYQLTDGNGNFWLSSVSCFENDEVKDA